MHSPAQTFLQYMMDVTDKS